MPNNFSNTDWVCMEILRLLLNKLVVVDYFNRSWEKEFKREFAPGDKVTVKGPQRFIASTGMSWDPQAINRISTTIALDTWIKVHFEWDDYERAVKLERSEEELRDNYWDPAAASMAQEWDSQAADWARHYTSMVVGALGTNPTAVSTYYSARQRLLENACPPGKKAMLVSSSMMSSIGANITTLFHPGDELARAFKEGYLGRLAGFDFFESNSLYSHTAGTWAGAVTVKGAGQSGTSLDINCTSGDTFKKGDKFSIANVNFVNPATRRVAGPATAKQFTVTADVTASGSTATLTILPAIYGPGSQYQNVNGLPADTAALTLWPGTTSPNGKVGTVGMGISRYAFAVAGARLYVPKAVESAGIAQDTDTGISIRKVKAWDAENSKQINRLDSLGGFGNLYQDNGAVAVVGA